MLPYTDILLQCYLTLISYYDVALHRYLITMLSYTVILLRCYLTQISHYDVALHRYLITMLPYTDILLRCYLTQISQYDVTFCIYLITMLPYTDILLLWYRIDAPNKPIQRRLLFWLGTESMHLSHQYNAAYFSGLVQNRCTKHTNTTPLTLTHQ